MPIGIIVNCSAVLIGGIIGSLIGKKMPKNLIEQLPITFGLGAIAIGIALIIQVENLTPVILAIIMGAVIGELLQIEERVKSKVGDLVSKTGGADQDKTEMLITVIVLFCFSGTGVFGALNEGFTGDASVLMAKSVLDFSTAVIFGASIGSLVGFVAIPQFITLFILYLFGGVIVPLLNPGMIGDFKACGGIITFAAGLKISNIKQINIMNILPCLFLVMILSYGWQLTGF